MFSAKVTIGSREFDVGSFTYEESLACDLAAIIEFYSDEPNITAKEMLGATAKIVICDSEDKEKTIVGIVDGIMKTDFSDRSLIAERHCYRAEIGSWFGQLQKTKSRQIFQECDLETIINKIFGKYSFPDFNVDIKNTAKYPYIVQYEESDFDFLMRLFSRYGVSFYFDYGSGSQKLCLFDNPDHYTAGPQETFKISHEPADNCLRLLNVIDYTAPGKASIEGYDPEDPESPIKSEEEAGGDYDKSSDPLDESSLEAHHFVSKQTGLDESHAKKLAMVELIKQRQNTKNIVVMSDSLHLEVGKKVTVPIPVDGSKVTVEEATYEEVELVVESIKFSIPRISQYDKTVRASCIPAARLVLPTFERQSPPPQIQSAKVTGVSEKNQVSTDDLGRVQVQFHWDHVGSEGEETSCWMRVMSPWAGSGNRGFVTLPRVGDEVVVAFVGEYQDDPVVIGSLYHKEHTLPFGGKDKGDHVGIRTQSVGGGDDNYNELVFVDTLGEEEVRLSAEKDFTISVKNDLKTEIENDQQTEIQGNSHTETKGNHDEKIEGEWSAERVKSARLNYQDSLDQSVGKDYSANFKANHTTEIAKDMSLTIDGKTNQVSKDELTIESKKTVTLKCGSASITLKSSGDVEIMGSKVTIKGAAGSHVVQ